MLAYTYLAIAILFEIAGTLMLKATDGFTHIRLTMIMWACYSISLYFLSLTLKTFSIGFAYAIWSGVGLALVAAMGVVIYKESVDISGMVGIGLIIAGVVILNLFSSMGGH